MIKTHQGVLPREVLHQFPLRSPPTTHGYAEWIPNFAGLEHVLGVAGLLDPDFHEVGEHVFWSRGVAEGFERVGVVGTRFGNDPVTVERYSNIVNLEEFFLAAADEAVDSDELLAWFAVVLERFWQRALRAHFPERRYLFEVTRNLYDEEGLCLTFWQDRSIESA
ncbi:MAG: hypothetical protein J0L92_22825 [Deltaproteobacteria bacterium]|nr:hypothetical protein [Deltaproteobacteria bacterium]